MARKTVKKAAAREHRWGGAGYVCINCGGIKDGSAARECPGPGLAWDVWLYHAGAGWWLGETYDSVEGAAAAIAAQLDTGNVVAAAVLPQGQRLGLFSKKFGT